MSNGEMQSLLNSKKTIKNEAKMKSIHSHLAKQMRTLVEKVADGLGSERGSGNLQLGQRVANDCKKTIFNIFGMF
jgi:hypothetical protein